MNEVDGVIARRLDSAVPLVGQVSRYIISAGGKRLRPALLLLVCGALRYTGPQRFNLAAVVEFIHTATLLHDDVVDESTLRRGRATANESFGTINATNLRRAHALIESGKAQGKVVLQGF